MDELHINRFNPLSQVSSSLFNAKDGDTSEAIDEEDLEIRSGDRDLFPFAQAYDGTGENFQI
jgi:hypothetical protein